jgi:hypothetical protein
VPQVLRRWKRSFTDPIWRCGDMEIRDVRKDGGQWARNGYDDTARYNLWVGRDWQVRNVSDGLIDLQHWAVLHWDELHEAGQTFTSSP